MQRLKTLAESRTNNKIGDISLIALGLKVEDKKPFKNAYSMAINQIRIFESKIRAMTTKLTLTVDKSIIERAKSYAKKTGRSLSEIIENYLATITQDSTEHELSPKLKKIVGAVNLPEDFDEKAELRSALEKKHI